MADQVADRSQVSKYHVYRLARDGKVPVVEIGRYQRFRPAAMVELERAGGCLAPDGRQRQPSAKEVALLLPFLLDGLDTPKGAPK
jgi:hypothetical protein